MAAAHPEGMGAAHPEGMVAAHPEGTGAAHPDPVFRRVWLRHVCLCVCPSIRLPLGGFLLPGFSRQCSAFIHISPIQ